MRFLETIRAENGTVDHLADHLLRMERTLNAFGIDKRYDLKALLDPPAQGLIRCRVRYDDTGCEISYHPYTPRRFRTLRAIIDETVDYTFKYTDRTCFNPLYAQKGESDEIVIVKRGLLTDATIANIALYDGTKWLTPARPLLRGTTRDRLLREGKLVEADIPLEEAVAFERCALMNAMLGFVEVECGIIA
jgi:4-amino-4-deoxychorismate lyase